MCVCWLQDFVALQLAAVILEKKHMAAGVKVQHTGEAIHLFCAHKSLNPECKVVNQGPEILIYAYDLPVFHSQFALSQIAKITL